MIIENSQYSPLWSSATVMEGMTQQRSSHRPELQGLRAISLIAVLLFHIWSSFFGRGYLGVDVFFVISGYLMCRLLSQKSQLGYENIVDFYFRRIKRIIPTYLFVIGLTILMAANLMARLDYHRLLNDAFPAVFFYSNAPTVHSYDYFNLNSKKSFLLHTWSLSVEMQFYLVVPVVFYFAQKVQRKSVITVLGSLLFVASFLRQLYAEGTAQHMALDGRIWQFLSGFAGHLIHHNLPAFIKSKEFSRAYEKILPFLDILIILALSVLLLFNFGGNDQIVRLFVILLATLYASLPNNGQSRLSNEALITLGNVSYSIYLIHWSIFTLHRFADEELYERNKEAPLSAGIWLIVISTAVGYILERGSTELLKCIKSFKSLFFILLFFYVLIGLQLLYVSQRAACFDVDLSIWEPPTGFAERVTENTVRLWTHRNQPIPLPANEAFQNNFEAFLFGVNNLGCTNRSAVLPTKYQPEKSLLRHVCNEKGNGSKTVVILGNSHAYATYFGVRRHFLDIASNITMFSIDACIPAPEKFQALHSEQIYRHRCEVYVNTTVEMLRNWNYPVDIIIALYGFHYDEDPGLVANWETDPMFTFMQDYYLKLGAIAREAMFVPSMSLHFTRHPLKVSADRLLDNEAVGIMGDTNQLEYSANIRHRIERISCPNCILMDWYRLWCSAEDGGFCPSVEPISRELYFMDKHHPTPFGSMFIGRFIRQHYDDFAGKGNNN